MWPFTRKIPIESDIPPKPTWLKWLLLVFIGYIIFVATQPDLPDKPNPVRKAIKETQENISAHEIADFDGYKSKLFPEHFAGLRMKEDKEGTGSLAVCGQKVAISYQTSLANGNALPDKATKEAPLEFVIGTGEVMPALELGVIGMKVGGTRTLYAPPLMSYTLENFRREDIPRGADIIFKTELLKATPAIPDPDQSPYRVIDIAKGNGRPVNCGVETYALLTIWNIQGKELYRHDDQNNPLRFTPGTSEIMMGIEQGVIGMRGGSIRLLIIPPSYQRAMQNNEAKISFDIPANEVLLVEVTALH